MEILHDFGVEPILLLAQLINFLILLFVLKKLLYGPIMKVLEERRNTIAQSVKQAEEIQKTFESVNQQKEDILQNAQKEATSIITLAKDEAKMLSAEIVTSTKADMEDMVRRTKESLLLEKQKIVSDAKNQIVDIIAVATEKVSAKAIGSEENKKLVEEAVKEIKS